MDQRTKAAGPGGCDDTPILLSIVVPMYDEEESCGAFFDRLLPVLESLTEHYEVICINDGSKDTTLQVLRAAHRENPRIKIIDLTRRFGKDVALSAGLDAATGRAVVPMDADLQDPPELIPDLVAKWRDGYDVVLAVRRNRKDDSLVKRLLASVFYRAAGLNAAHPPPPQAGDFRLVDQTIVRHLRRFPERDRFMKSLFAWVGSRQTSVSFDRPGRFAGGSKWRPWSLWNFGISGIVSTTTLPLRIWTYVGGALILFTLVVAAADLWWPWNAGVGDGFVPSINKATSFLTGLNLMAIGTLGEYVARIHVEVRQRPLYLARERIGFEDFDPLTARETARRND